MNVGERGNTLRAVADQILSFWFFQIVVYYILLAEFRYVINYKAYTKYLQWATIGFFLFFFLYTIILVFLYEDSRRKVLATLKKVCSLDQVFLFGLLLWYIISLYYNENYGLFRTYLGYNNYFKICDWSLFDTVMCICVLFPMARIYGKNKAKRIIELVIHILVVSYSIFSLWCLWHVFHLEVITLPSGMEAGMTAKTQLLLGYHNNTTGMIALTLFVLCIYMIFTQIPIISAIYCILGLINLVVLYLSNSRTIFVGCAVFIAYIVFIISMNYQKTHNMILRTGISILATVIAVGIIAIGRTIMFILFEKITHFSEAFAAEADQIIAYKKSFSLVTLSARSSCEIRLQMIDVEGTRGIDGVRRFTDLSGRSVLWPDCIALMFFKPSTYFFGVTPVEVTSALSRLPGHHYWKVAAHAHNIILQIGVSMGFPAMMMFVAYLVNISIKCMRISLRKGDTLLPIYHIIIGILLCFIIINMAESYLVSYFSVMGCFFFIFCGLISVIEKDYKERIIQKMFK